MGWGSEIHFSGCPARRPADPRAQRRARAVRSERARVSVANRSRSRRNRPTRCDAAPDRAFRSRVPFASRDIPTIDSAAQTTRRPTQTEPTRSSARSDDVLPSRSRSRARTAAIANAIRRGNRTARRTIRASPATHPSSSLPQTQKSSLRLPARFLVLYCTFALELFGLL